jgi:hypothetical protein
MWQHQWTKTSATPPVDDTGGFLRPRPVVDPYFAGITYVFFWYRCRASSEPATWDDD